MIGPTAPEQAAYDAVRADERVQEARAALAAERSRPAAPAPDRLVRAGSIMRRNGAWLIVVHDPEGEAVPDDEFDVAGSQREARRIARRMAEEWGFRGPWRWVDETTAYLNNRGSYWSLEGTPPPDETADEDED